MFDRLQHYGIQNAVDTAKSTVVTGTGITNTELVNEVIATSGGMFDDTDRPYLTAMTTEELQRWRDRLAGSLTASPIIVR